MSTYWLTEASSSLNGSMCVISNGSPVSDTSFEMVCEMLKGGGNLPRSLGLGAVFPKKTQSLTNLDSWKQCPEPVPESISPLSTSDDIPNFNPLRTVIGRKKTDIYIDDMGEKGKSENEITHEPQAWGMRDWCLELDLLCYISMIYSLNHKTNLDLYNTTIYNSCI